MIQYAIPVTQCCLALTDDFTTSANHTETGTASAPHLFEDYEKYTTQTFKHIFTSYFEILKFKT